MTKKRRHHPTTTLSEMPGIGRRIDLATARFIETDPPSSVEEEVDQFKKELAEANSKIDLLTRVLEMVADAADFDPYLVEGWLDHKKGHRRERFDRHRWS